MDRASAGLRTEDYGLDEAAQGILEMLPIEQG